MAGHIVISCFLLTAACGDYHYSSLYGHPFCYGNTILTDVCCKNMTNIDMGCLQGLRWLLIFTSSVSALSHFCGETPYNLGEKMCCDSKLSDLIQDGQIIKCCRTSGETYKPGSEICCGGVFDRTFFENQRFSCCNGKTIKEGKEMCCGGERIELEQGKGCCRNKSYALRGGHCCKDTLYNHKEFKGHCCGSETYDNRTHQCHQTNTFVGALPLYIQRCGTVNINTSTHACCNEDTPVDITGYKGEFPPVCCNKTIIPDKKAFICYLDHILPRNQLLCEKKTENNHMYIRYNLNEEWCCNGMVIRKNSTSDRKETCCGSEVIDLSTQTCCAKREPYEHFKYYCCGDTVVDSKEMCCGTTKLTENQVCCNEPNKIFPVEKQDRFHDACCKGKSYARANKTCPSDDPPPTCGKHVMNTQRDVCCSNTLFKGVNGPDMTCCGAYIRNITYQGCVHGRLTNRTVTTPSNSNRKSHVCGRKNIRVRTRKDLCCMNSFYKNAKHNGFRCCGAYKYDKQTHKCCHSRPVPLNSPICKRRSRRHYIKHSPPLKCSSQEWIRKRPLKKMNCIQHAYVMKRESDRHTYRTKRDLVQKKHKGQMGTWKATPFCNHVSKHKRFIFITIPSGNYTLKYSKKARNLIKKIPLCHDG